MAALADPFRVFSVMVYKSEQISCISQHLYLGSISEVISRKKKLGNYNICCCFSTGFVICFVSSFSSCGHPEMTGMYRNSPIPRRIKFKKQFYDRTQGGKKKNARLVIFPNSSCHEIEMLSGSLSKLVGLNSRNSDFLTKAALWPDRFCAGNSGRAPLC